MRHADSTGVKLSKAWKVKIKQSRVYECQAKTAHKCTGRFVRTYPDQTSCLLCQFVPTPSRIEGNRPNSRKGEAQSNENIYLNKSTFAEASVSTTERSAGKSGHDKTKKFKDKELYKKLVELIKEKRSITSIANYFKVDRTSVRYHIRKLNGKEEER